jgi:feruloyl-CoA synthase
MTILKLVDTNAEQHPDKLALCDMETKITFEQLRDKSEQAAACFQARGIKRGDPVAIMGQNSFHFIFAFFGVLKAGGVVVPVNHKLTAPEVDYILKDSRARLFLFDGSLKNVASLLEQKIDTLSMDTRADNIAFIGDAMTAADPFTPLPIEPDDLAKFKIPRNFHFLSELPHTPSGKVMKYKLRQQFKNQ